MNRFQQAASESRQLPAPGPEAQQHSLRLQQTIADEITAQGGNISFARFMELALYAPGLGYYVAGSRKFGEAGDFVTAPEISPLFSRALARQCQQVLAEVEGGDILEFGAGSGVMAADILLELVQQDCLPNHYYILELSAELRQRQQQTIADKAPQLLSRVVWLDGLPQQPINGVILANEVLDAMPVELFEVTGDGLLQGRVEWEEGRFALQFTPAHTLALEGDAAQFIRQLPTGYRSEYNAAAVGWINSLAGVLQQGAAFLLDYGFPRHEFYHPQRHSGTLMCHYRHRSHPEPLILVGLQDITAHVDFTLLAEAAVAAGFAVSGFTNQAHFLMSLGITEMLAEVDPSDVKAQMVLAQQIKKLTLPNEMGELFKVIGLSKGLEQPLRGFVMNDQRQRL